MSTDNAGLVFVMQSLADTGWCVVLKRLPKGYPWLAGGDPSEYGGSPTPECIGMDQWLAEASSVVRDGPWRKSQYGAGDTAELALAELAEMCEAEEARVAKLDT